MKDWDISQVTSDLFIGRENEKFILVYAQGEIEVELEDILLRPATTPGENGIPAEIREQPFSLLFRGPTEPELFSGTAALKHPQIGLLDQLFVNCIGADPKGRQYNMEFS